MNTAPRDFDDTSRLISSLLDGTLSPNDRVLLETRLSQDADARRTYLQMIDQEIELACLLAPDRDRTPQVLSPVIEGEKRRESPPVWRLLPITWLAAGAAAVIALVVFRWPRRPDAPVNPDTISWTADFENGNAAGWTGTVVSAGLPAGSKFGIRSIDQSDNGTVSSQIKLPEDWQRGLFSLTPRSTLNLTYRRISQGGWMDVFIHTDGGDPQQSQQSMFMLRQGKFPGQPGVWQTVAIPFSNFVRKIPDPVTGQLSFVGGPPHDGERVLTLGFGGSPGFDFIIDRLWITEDGTGAETMQTLPQHIR